MAETLMQKYYSINRALSTYLQARGITCPIYKYGIDPATLKANARDQSTLRYPYFQSFIPQAPKQAPWTTAESGVLTEFEMQFSFFTAPSDEFVNDAANFVPFEALKNALCDINARVLSSDYAGETYTIADLLRIREPFNFSMKSGNVVPAAVLLAEFRTVCAYGIDVPGPGTTTDLDNAISITMEQ